MEKRKGGRSRKIGRDERMRGTKAHSDAKSVSGAKIGSWIDAGADALKALAQKQDADGPMLDRALEVVRQFITQRSLILYGGMALDCALRLHGGRIYPDDERPDYDVMSPRSVEDAYDLAEILRARGFVRVGAIRALHAQTMRVRTDFQTVADISYAPPKVFENMPTVEFRGMRVLHPNYQRMDMHLAFCYPFKGAPKEDVFHRWKKDLKRFNLVEKLWPIMDLTSAKSKPSMDLTSAKSSIDLTLAKSKKATAKLSFEMKISRSVLTNCALSGFAAYFVLRRALRELAETLAKSGMIEAQRAKSICELAGVCDENKDIQEMKIESVLSKDGSVTSKDDVNLTLPVASLQAREKWPLVLMSPHPVATVKAIEKSGGAASVSWSVPYMDARPEMAEIKSESSTIHVYSTEHKLLSTSVVKISDIDVVVATPQAVLLWFLFEYHMQHHDASVARDETYLIYYRNTLDIINAAGKMLTESKYSGDPRTALKFINSSPFFLSTRTLGASNYDEASLIRIARTARDVGEEPPVNSEMGDIRRLLEGLPMDYYPEKRARPAQFDYSGVLFLRDGSPRDGSPQSKSVPSIL